MIREWSRGQWVLRVVAALGPPLALLCLGPSGAWPSLWQVVLVALCSTAYARWPESGAGAVVLSLVVIWWGLSLDDGLHAWALLAAALLLASHLAGVVVSYGPDRLAVDPATLRLWGRRGLLLWCVSAALYGVALLLRGRPETPGVWVAGLSVALVALVGATVMLHREE